jgi:tetratricopeptide (TPR) repeat protein
VTIKGPRFRSAKINPNRKLGFNLDRELPFGKKGVTFRKKGVTFRKGIKKFRNGGISNIDLAKNEDPVKLNNMGVKYYNKGKYKIALTYFDKALAVAPRFEDAHKNRVYCIQMMRQRTEEQRKVKTARQIASDYYRPQEKTKKGAVEVQPLDNNATRFAEHHQFGKISSQTDYDRANAPYYKPYWDYYRR